MRQPNPLWVAGSHEEPQGETFDLSPREGLEQFPYWLDRALSVLEAYDQERVRAHRAEVRRLEGEARALYDAGRPEEAEARESEINDEKAPFYVVPCAALRPQDAGRFDLILPGKELVGHITGTELLQYSLGTADVSQLRNKANLSLLIGARRYLNPDTRSREPRIISVAAYSLADPFGYSPSPEAEDTLARFCELAYAQELFRLDTHLRPIAPLWWLFTSWLEAPAALRARLREMPEAMLPSWMEKKKLSTVERANWRAWLSFDGKMGLGYAKDYLHMVRP